MHIGTSQNVGDGKTSSRDLLKHSQEETKSDQVSKVSGPAMTCHNDSPTENEESNVAGRPLQALEYQVTRYLCDHITLISHRILVRAQSGEEAEEEESKEASPRMK